MGCGGSTSRVVSPELKQTEGEGTAPTTGLTSDVSPDNTAAPTEAYIEENKSPDEIQNSSTVVLETNSEANTNTNNNNTVTFEEQPKEPAAAATFDDQAQESVAATKIQAHYRGYVTRKSVKSESDSVFLKDAAHVNEKTEEAEPTTVVSNALDTAVRRVSQDKSDETENKDKPEAEPEKDEVLWTSPAFTTCSTQENDGENQHVAGDESATDSDQNNKEIGDKEGKEESTAQPEMADDGHNNKQTEDTPQAEQPIESGVETKATTEADSNTDPTSLSEDPPTSENDPEPKEDSNVASQDEAINQAQPSEDAPTTHDQTEEINDTSD